VVVGFSGPVGMLNSPHVQMAESSSKKNIFIFYRLLGQLTKLATSSYTAIGSDSVDIFWVEARKSLWYDGCL
jgi:hypothetical protein